MMIFKEKTQIWGGRGGKLGKKWKMLTVPMENNIIFEGGGGINIIFDLIHIQGNKNEIQQRKLLKGIWVCLKKNILTTVY